MLIIREIKNADPINTPKSVFKYLTEFKHENREYFIVIGLDTKNKPTYREINSIGTLNSSLIHPREVFKKAIIMSCNSIIIAHNHPSGDITPSDEDFKITKKLKEIGEIIGIKVLDHIIIAKNNFYSFEQKEEYQKIR
jgi:DNA repair protein RadC